MLDEEANETAAEFVRDKIREIVDDPEVAEIAGARVDYPFGTKRLCLDTDYYATFNRDNVTSSTSGPRRSWRSPHGPAHDRGRVRVRRARVRHRLRRHDRRAARGSTSRAAAARTLRDEWAAGPRTYLGLGVAGFPNLFTITGPGSPSVLSNMIVSIEQHVDWIADCMTFMRERDLATIEADAGRRGGLGRPRPRGGRRSRCTPRPTRGTSGANVPGKPRVFMPYVGGVGAYRRRCDEVASRGYEGFVLA